MMDSKPRASKKRTQIVLAARDVFLESGYGGSSMDAIAAAAGVSKATVYAHFSNKEQLFSEMVSAYCREQQAAVAEIEAEHFPVEEGLRRIALTIMRYLAHPRALAFGKMIIGEAGRFPDLGRAFVESGSMDLQRQIEGFLARASDRGELDVKRPALEAELFVSMLRGTVQHRSLLARGRPPSGPELEAIAAAAAHLMTAGRAR